jgi:signal transduction histidine kinase
VIVHAETVHATGGNGAQRFRDAAVRFEVRDEGPGIPREHQAGLFEKFFRVPGSPEGGSGLGLFIAKGLVEAHGGTIGLDSATGCGAIFWFTLPAAPTLEQQQPDRATS